jgi:tetratricopeptide (TPR) repeat protein
MLNLSIRLLAMLLLFSTILRAQDAKDDLDRYVERLRLSAASGGKETAFMSAGADFLYGQDYFEAKNFSSASWYFQDVVKKEKDNAFANYQLAISLIRQNDKYKTQQAQEYLERAFQLNPTLKDRYVRDVPAARPVAKTSVQPNAPEQTLAAPKEGLDNYIEKLKYSQAIGGKETEMNSAGRDVLYGYEYYVKGEYRSAATDFHLALDRDPENPYINYLLAVSYAAQGEKAKAASYYNKAISGDASLKNQYAKDVADATARHQKYEDGRKVPVTPPPAKPVYGGSLVYGNYTCHQSVWNGPNASPAYSHKYHGYFELKKDGTYRWLDDGKTGRYTYNAKTGAIQFVSGHLASAKSARYQRGTTVPQITVNYTDSYRWECGCKK